MTVPVTVAVSKGPCLTMRCAIGVFFFAIRASAPVSANLILWNNTGKLARFPALAGNPLVPWLQERAWDEHARLVHKETVLLKTYHRYLQKLRGRQVRVLELGIQSGGSLEMWLNYFGEGAHAYGCDIEPRVKEYASERVTVFVGDMGDPRFLHRVRTSIPQPIDFVLDDASHISWHQKLAFEMIFPYVNPDGGVYMVEDLQKNYAAQSPWNAGLHSEGSFVAFAKKKIDELHGKIICQERNVPQAHCKEAHTNFTRTTTGIHVHQNIIVFEKSPNPDSMQFKSGRLIIPKKTSGFMGLTEAKSRKIRDEDSTLQ